jgi:retron-type reverse transcriptase
MGKGIQSILLGDPYERLCMKGMLRGAFKEVKRNKGVAGIDNVSIEDFESNLEENLDQLGHELTTWIYRPNPVRRV